MITLKLIWFITLLVLAVTCIMGMFIKIANASPVGGSKTLSGLITSEEYDIHRLLLRGEQSTTIDVTAEPKGEIDCCLLDNQSNIIDCDIGIQNTCKFTYIPSHTSQVFLKVWNNAKNTTFYSAAVR